MRTRLDQIEARLQKLIEGSAALLLRGNLQHRLAHQLVSAVQENINVEPDGRMIAPAAYTIILNPDTEAYWKAHSALLESISSSLQEAAREYGINFMAEPQLNLSSDPQMPQEEVQVVASEREAGRGQTMIFPPMRAEPARNAIPPNAFLIVDGSRVFPLDQAVINIGRRSDNHLVLADPRVSRAHAQLRAIRGQYVIFDLNSTGGTQVNGQRIHQHTLKPGDVVSLSGVPLIYGEDQAPGQDGDPTGSTRTVTNKPPPEVIE